MQILLEAGEQGASSELHSLIRSVQQTSRNVARVEMIQETETFPKSTALDSSIRKKLERKSSVVHPWDVEETIEELHRRGYYPRSSRQQDDKLGVTRWPKVLRAAVEGNADLAISSFGAALFYLQRNLIDADILGMGIVKAYIPPSASAAINKNSGRIDGLMNEGRLELDETNGLEGSSNGAPCTPVGPVDFSDIEQTHVEDQISYLSLDGTTLHNLEILTNSVDHKVSGSLWSKINFTKTPHGARLLRAWLLRPLFRKSEIDRRADAVEELVSGAGAFALSEAQQVLGKIGDLERLIARVHSMSGMSLPGSRENENDSYHPNDRAVLYEGATYTKRKVGDFSKLLNGCRQLDEVFVFRIRLSVDVFPGRFRSVARTEFIAHLFSIVFQIRFNSLNSFACSVVCIIHSATRLKEPFCCLITVKIFEKPVEFFGH